VREELRLYRLMLKVTLRLMLEVVEVPKIKISKGVMQVTIAQHLRYLSRLAYKTRLFPQRV
jgi:hypothetical protein